MAFPIVDRWEAFARGPIGFQHVGGDGRSDCGEIWPHGLTRKIAFSFLANTSHRTQEPVAESV